MLGEEFQEIPSSEQDLDTKFKGRRKGAATERIWIAVPGKEKPVQVEVKQHNGIYLLDGDIAVDPVPQGAVGVRKFLRWENGVIPYSIERGHPARDSILAAIRELNRHTKLCFRQRTTEDNYVLIKYDPSITSGWSHVGDRPLWLENIVTLGRGFNGKGGIIHELLHTAGLFHEQSRSDRDDYIRINWENIQEGAESNFEKHNWLIAKDIHDYNFESVMHYAPYTFSKNGKPTIEAHDPNQDFGQLDGLSQGDIDAINAMYYFASPYNCGNEAPLKDDAAFVMQSVPRNMTVYQPAEISLTFLNNGETTWTPSYKIVSLSKGWNVQKIPIGETVPPGQKIEVRFKVTALSPGDYYSHWSMAPGFGKAFGETSKRVSVRVTSDSNGDDCKELQSRLVQKSRLLIQYQKMLHSAGPSQKPAIIQLIKQVSEEIASIKRQMTRLGCA